MKSFNYGDEWSRVTLHIKSFAKIELTGFFCHLEAVINFLHWRLRNRYYCTVKRKNRKCDKVISVIAILAIADLKLYSFTSC